MLQYNRNDLEIAARNHHCTRDTFEKALRLKTILDFCPDTAAKSPAEQYSAQGKLVQDGFLCRPHQHPKGAVPRGTAPVSSICFCFQITA